MSDEQANETEAEAKKGGLVKLILMIGLPLLLLGAGAGAAVALLGFGPSAEATAVADEAGQPVEDPSDIVFVDLPDMLVNLNVTGRRMRFLKIATALEVDGEDEAERVRQFVPRILDSFHMYLRAVSPEDLQGSEGAYRIKEELLARTNDAIRPAQVRDVLVRELLVQ